MKKVRLLWMTFLLLLPIATSPLPIYADVPASQVLLSTEKESTVLTQPLPATLVAEPQSITSTVNVFGNLSQSAFLANSQLLTGSLSLGASFLAAPAAPILIPAMIGLGLAVGSYQLGAQLGVLTNDLAKTTSGLYESLSADPDLQDELTEFALAGTNSTTSTYHFSQGLQTHYARDVTSNSLMREYLTGTSDHGAYNFTINTNPAFRTYINYESSWAERERLAVIGRDTSVSKDKVAPNRFFLLQRACLIETTIGSNEAMLYVTGDTYVENGVAGYMEYRKELGVSMDTLLTQLPTKEALLEYIQQITTFELGSLATPSKELAVQTARTMAKEYTVRTTQINDRLAEALAPTENGLRFDPSGMIATLHGQTIILDRSGQFIHAQTKEVIPAYQWGAIDFSYSEEAIPIDDSITVKEKRGVLDEETGDIIDDTTKEVLIKSALGTTWTSLSMQILRDRIKELKKEDDDPFEWYTPLDLIYDELFARGGKGHTIAKHISKTEEELKARFLLNTDLEYSATFHNVVQALIYINAAIFTANQEYLDGSVKIPLGTCSLQTANNRVSYRSHPYLSLGQTIGWGVYKKRETSIYIQHNIIINAKVIIPKTREVIRKNRKYYVLTAYPDLKRKINELD